MRVLLISTDSVQQSKIYFEVNPKERQWEDVQYVCLIWFELWERFTLNCTGSRGFLFLSLSEERKKTSVAIVKPALDKSTSWIFQILYKQESSYSALQL